MVLCGFVVSKDTLKKGQPVRRMTAWCLCGCLRQMDATAHNSIFMVVCKEFEFDKRPKNLKLLNPEVFHNSRYHVFVRPDGTQLFTIYLSTNLK